jgi:hypothetical protein
VVADHLRQIELGVNVRRDQELDLLLRVGVRVRPAAQRDRVIAYAQQLAKLPGVVDRPGWAHQLVASEHDQRRKPALERALAVREAVLERMLGCQDRHDALAGNVASKICDQMAQVVLFRRSDGAVGQEDERALAREPAHGVVRVYPRVHALPHRELRARRAQLRREHAAAGPQRRQEIRDAHGLLAGW